MEPGLARTIGYAINKSEDKIRGNQIWLLNIPIIYPYEKSNTK